MYVCWHVCAKDKSLSSSWFSPAGCIHLRWPSHHSMQTSRGPPQGAFGVQMLWPGQDFGPRCSQGLGGRYLPGWKEETNLNKLKHNTFPVLTGIFCFVWYNSELQIGIFLTLKKRPLTLQGLHVIIQECTTFNIHACSWKKKKIKGLMCLMHPLLMSLSIYKVMYKNENWKQNNHAHSPALPNNIYIYIIVLVLVLVT
jgi:hypothetical protein